jgi:2-keto-4-pentenoate hydratase
VIDLGGMLELRRSLLAQGAEPLGWKVGFGAPAAIEKLGTGRPLVGFLTDRGLLPDGATVSIGDWANPMLEAEVAVHLARDVEGDAAWEQVRDAVGGLSAAIELADVHPPPTDVEAILAGNIYHRHVLLGPIKGSDPSTIAARPAKGSDPSTIAARLVRDGEEIAATDAPEELTGERIEVVRLTAELLAENGARLRAGEVVITGSIFAPVSVAPGERVTAEIPPLGSLSVQLRG